MPFSDEINRKDEDDDAKVAREQKRANRILVITLILTLLVTTAITITTSPELMEILRALIYGGK